jgi:hypothetical protein
MSVNSKFAIIAISIAWGFLIGLYYGKHVAKLEQKWAQESIENAK